MPSLGTHKHRRKVRPFPKEAVRQPNPGYTAPFPISPLGPSYKHHTLKLAKTSAQAQSPRVSPGKPLPHGSAAGRVTDAPSPSLQAPN